jgi:hypothetical protein
MIFLEATGLPLGLLPTRSMKRPQPSLSGDGAGQSIREQEVSRQEGTILRVRRTVAG